MKNLTKLLKFGIMIFAIALIAVACDKNDELINDELINDEANLKQIKLPVKSHKVDFINSQHHSKLSEQINSINQKLNKKKSSTEVSYDIIIVLEDVLFTEYDNTHTYTFKILREQPLAYVENLVLHFNNSSQNYDEYLVQYNITANEFVELSNDGQLQSSENVMIRTLEQGFFDSNTFSKICETVCETIYVTCSSGEHHSGNIGDWGSCTENERGGTLPSAYQSCTPSCPSIDQGDSGNGDGTGSGGGGTSGDGVIITNPNANEPCESGSGIIGITGSDGCITTTEDIARNNLFDRLSSYMTNQDQADWIVLEADIQNVNALNNYLDEASYYNQAEFKNSAIELINFHKKSDWKDILRQAVANGVTSTAEVTHKIYKELSEIANDYPLSISYINNVVDEFRAIADDAFDTNPQTLDWLDLFGIWLFELGEYPQDTITFDGDDVTTENLKQQEGVSLARQDAIDKITNNDITEPVNRGWTYGQGEFYDGMANGNIATSFLGSYNTRVDITQNLGGTHTLTFKVSNPSTWESATRLRIDNDNDGNHDGIFPNKNRGDGINLGGTINQTWIWTEIVN